MSKLLVTANQITVRKNSGANVGSRPRLNFIEGAGTTLTVADDGGGNEVDITITSGGVGGGDWLKQFFPAVDTNDHKAAYATIRLPDAATTNIYQTFMMPSGIASLTRAVIIVIPSASGNIYWEGGTNFGAVCSNENYQTHVDIIAPTISAVTQNEIECLDISSGLTGALGGDLVGLMFTRFGAHANDTISDNVHFMGILIEGTT